MILNPGRKNEVAVRVVIESETYGRDCHDYGSLERCLGGVIRMAKDAIECAGQDGVSRVVGLAIIPRSDYGDEAGYYPEYVDEETGCKAHRVEEPTTEGVAVIEVLAQTKLALPKAALPAKSRKPARSRSRCQVGSKKKK